MKPQRKHILVVEDEQHLAIGIRFNLEAEGYRVTAVGDGQTALQCVQDAEPPVDLVVLDLMLPGMSGYAVCETLRNTGYDMPILILSARTLAEDRTRGFDAGANQYLSKPFDLDELLARVKNLLHLHYQRGVRPPAESREVSFGDAQINFQTHEVSVAGKPLRLTNLELKLLRYFTENAGRVIPRHELLENVWGIPGHVNTRAPDQILRRLRRAFERSSGEPRHFLTIRDAGYRFVPNPDETPPDKTPPDDQADP